MALTRDDINLLAKPFRRAEHEFTRGYVYITEGAITARLDEVDPNWTFEIQQLSVRDKQGVCAARLTVQGVTRENVGMQVIEYQKDSDKEAGEAEKGAATDALKRCARLFGIGRYLLDDPPKVVMDGFRVKDDSAFNAWLKDKQKTWYDAHAPKTEDSKVVHTIEPERPTPAPLPAPTANTAPAASPEPKHVTVTNVNDIDSIVFGQSAWDKMLNENADTITVTEIVKQKSGQKEYYRLIGEGVSVAVWSTTVLQLLGITYMDLTLNRKTQLRDPIIVPFVKKGDYLNADEDLIKSLLAVKEAS